MSAESEIEERPTELRTVWLGRMAFDQALALQLQTREAVLAGSAAETLFLVEHPPTLTLGRRGRREDILWTDEQLEAQGLAVCETPRGGQVTLHAPGQLVAYPVVRIGRQIRKHLENLAHTTRAMLAELGVTGTLYREDHPGVWLDQVKLASIGVHISRGVTVQGLSVNLAVDPMLFSALVSCGLEGNPVVSVRDVGGRVIEPEAAAEIWARHWGEQTGCAIRWDS